MNLEYIECPITNCTYFIITKQNKKVFLEYCENTLMQLKDRKKINFSLRCQSFLYGKSHQIIKIIQFAECFSNFSIQNSKNVTVDIKNGMILLSPLENDVKNKLSELFKHINVKIFTYDFTSDITYLMEENISFDFKSIIDCNINKFTGMKMFELPYSSLFAACKKSKLFQQNKALKNKNFHTSSEFSYNLQKAEQPINSLFDSQFWESIVCDCAYVAIACSNAIFNFGINKIMQFTSEKVKTFCELQKKYGIFGPFLMKKFFNNDSLLHSKEIPDKNYAYDLWNAAQNAILHFDIYREIVPLNRQLTKTDILNIQKNAERKILNFDDEQEIKQTENSTNEQNTTFNKKFNKNLNRKTETKDSYESKKRTGIYRIDEIIKTLDIFVKQNSPYLTELQTNWNDLYPLFVGIQNILPFNEPTFISIENSIQNIKKYNQSIGKKKFSKETKKFITHNVNDILFVLKTYLNFLMSNTISKESKIIEKKLFKIIFNPTKDDSYITKIFSVYQKHDDFINTNESIVNFKSSTGSGKTRCAPFFFAIKAIEDKMKRPFFIMTQPGFSIIKDKIKDFQNILGNSVTLVKNIWEMVDLYTSFVNSKSEKNKNKNLFSKPIVGLFSPQSLLTLIHKLQKRRINICSITRFCLDEIHERSVESDVLEAILSTNMNEMTKNGNNFPLQLLMMSATPDTRILNCFNKVARFELPNSQLFPVETIQVRLENKNQINNEIFVQTCEIIKKMATKKIQNGHILIFTSGNSRINDIQTEIFEKAEENCSSVNCIVVVIRNFDQMFKNSDVGLFYSNLDDFIHKETNRISAYYKKSRHILFLLPIKYMGYVSNEQKEIGKNPIPKHSNVIKIIMATNAIESSITIDGLAAVVDSGLFNHSSYDKNNGLTSLNEEPISIQSQTQRKGRVGRIRPGISVQITLKDKQLQTLLPPAIKTSDISLNILSLRKIGYRLENIRNLPDSLEKEEINRYISELISFNALDRYHHNLTSYGKILGNFSFVSPFIASAIIKVSGFKPDEMIGKNNNKNNERNYIEKQFRLLLGILISLLFGASDLCINRFSRKLRYYFDEKSDIITLLRTLLDLAQMKTIDIKSNAFYYGLNAQIAVKILGQVQQAAENLFFSNKEIRQINNNENESKSTNEQNININKQTNDSNKKQADEKTEQENDSNKKQADETVEQENSKKESANIVIGSKNQNDDNKTTNPIITETNQPVVSKGHVIQKKSPSTITIEKNKSSPKLIIIKSSTQINNTDTNPNTEEPKVTNDLSKHTEDKDENLNDTQDINKEDDNNNEETTIKVDIDPKKLFSRKNIFKYLQQLVDKLISDNLLYKFIQDLINEIGKNKPDWINCRRAKFANIEYAYDEPSFIYSGDKSLSNDNSSSYICVRMRPGSVALDSPGSVYILSITHELNSRINYGSLIHCDLTEEEKNPIPHPISIEISSRLFNDFSESLIESYLSDNLTHFKKFCRERWNRNDEGNCLLFKSQDVISESNIKYYFSFIPKDDLAIKLLNEASIIIEPLLAYTPSTILIKHPNLKCAIAIRGAGTDKIDSSVHFFKDKDCFPYQLNQTTINFLINNIDFLSSFDEIISIGITGESFCYPLGDSSIKKQYSKVWYPQSNPNCSSVFSNEPFFYSHLVMLSKIEFNIFNKFLLPWDSDLSSLEIVEDDLILHAANEIARDLIIVRKSFTRLLVTTEKSYLKQKGSYTPVYSYRSLLSPKENKVTSEINNIFYQLVKQYIEGDTLKEPVGLTAMFYAIPRDEILNDIGNIPKAKNRNVFGYGCYCFDIDDDDAIDEVETEIRERLNLHKEIESKAFQLIKECPEIKPKVFNIIDEINDELFTLIILEGISKDKKIVGKYFELNDKKEYIKNEISIQIHKIASNNSYWNFSHQLYGQNQISIFNNNKQCNDYTFQLINQNKKLRCNVLQSIPDYLLTNIQIDEAIRKYLPKCLHDLKQYNLLINHKTEFLKKTFALDYADNEMQKFIFNEAIKIERIRSHIISASNQDYYFNQNFFNYLEQNNINKEQFIELLYQSQNFNNVIITGMVSGDEIYLQIKTNDELQNLFFDFIDANEVLKNRLFTFMKKDNDIMSKLFQAIKKQNKTTNIKKQITRIKRDDSNSKFEKLQVYSVTVKHNIRSSLSKEDFEEKVTSVVSQFGAIIAKQHRYSEKWTMNGMVKGTITILMYSSYFTLPLVSMIKDVLQETNSCSTLNIPNNIIDNILLNDHTVSNILKEWFKSNELDIKQNDIQLTGNEKDVKKALDKLKTDPPEIPFKAYPIQGHINLFQINNHVKHINRNKETKWYFNRHTRTLLIPSNEDENEITNFFSQFNINVFDDDDDDTQSTIEEDENKIDKLLWDINFHEESAILSRYLINIYLRSGKLIQRHFCVDCVYETFLYNLRKMYNEDEDRGIYEEIINDDQLIPQMTFVDCKQYESQKHKNLIQIFPIIPFGQLIWSFINETKISNQTKTWITALSLRILKKTPKITFCPIHPYILFPSPPIGSSMKCVTPNCCFSLCCWCNKWHKIGKCDKQPEITPGVRQCPFCKELIEKSQACNHIHCRCGKDFCYYCGKGFDSSESCYKHMTDEKHWEEAPDYAKYIKNQIIDISVINDFYKKYPYLRPKLKGS